MAESAITKKALSNAMKKLICDHPFSKISISDICDLCEMNRKSFYYHFKDKYDLVNRTFDSELREYTKENDSFVCKVNALCCYLYENRDYYKRVFKIEGQNSFRSHFCSFVTELVESKYQGSSKNELQAQFAADGFACAVERWITDSSCMPTEKFSSLLLSILDTLDR